MPRAAMVIALLAIAAGAAGADDDQGDPALDYLLQCQGCHLASGRGVAAAGVPRMDARVGRFVGVEGGRAYLVRVPGVAQAPLSDAALAELLNWLLLRFSADELPDPFVPFAEAEVARHRARPLDDPAATRAALLEEIAASE